MSWNDIRDAMERRLKALKQVNRLHHYLRYVPESSLTPEWQRIMLEPATRKLNVWMVTRAGTPVDRVTPDTDGAVNRRHPLELHGYMQLNDGEQSEDRWNECVDAILDSITFGDRSLGGKCLTYGLPTTRDQGIFSFQGEIDCHHVVYAMDVEEVLPLTAPTAPTLPSGDPKLPLEDLADAIILAIQPRVTGLNLASLAWDTSYGNEPAYMSDPVAECPRLRLRYESVEPIQLVGGEVGNGTDFNVGVSLIYQIRQVPQSQHQRIMLMGLEQVAATFLNNMPAVLRVVGTGGKMKVSQAIPSNITFYPDLNHELGDPRLRVSSASLRLDLHGILCA